MRTAPQKLRNRSNANQANLIQSSPRTRVNRYISRLIEARQTESDTADLNFLTLMYKCSEREQRVRDFRHCRHTLYQTDLKADGWMCFTHSHLVSGITQYHQVPDEYFTSAVVLSLILAALFGLVYLLIIPQYVQEILFLFISLFHSLLFSLINPSIFLSHVFPLRGTAVLVLLVFCICFLVACIMYLHITRVQVITAAFEIPNLCVNF